MGGEVSPGTLEDMTGDFLPQRRQASLRIQLLSVVLIIAVALGAVYVLT
jgi:hypothetical protein